MRTVDDHYEEIRAYNIKLREIEHELKELGWVYLAQGRMRKAYRSPDCKFVAKLAKYDCADNNLYELNRWLHYTETGEAPYPLAQIIDHFSHDGVSILLMEYVRPINYFLATPNWVMTVDCGQVGYNNEGNLVAYDYGY